jgi:O-antigen ligase
MHHPRRSGYFRVAASRATPPFPHHPSCEGDALTLSASSIRGYLQRGGIVQLYALFIAGYFLLPMAAGHRRVYYLLLLPAVLVLWRELLQFYRHHALAWLACLYTGYMLLTLGWSPDVQAMAATWAVRDALCSLSFVLLSGYLWARYPERIQALLPRALWLAAGAALVSIAAWYLRHPFPNSRLEPLGVMHHANDSACAYGVFLVFACHRFFGEEDRRQRVVYALIATVLLALVLLTQSRTALAAVCAGLLALAGRRALGVVSVAVAASWLAVAATPGFWQQRVMQWSFRPGIWREVLSEARERPWFGHGLLEEPVVRAYGQVFSHAHNGYLAALRDGGVVGLVILLALLALALRWAWWQRQREGDSLPLALLLYAAVCIGMDYDRILVHPTELWLFFWLPLALSMAAASGPGHRGDSGAGGQAGSCVSRITAGGNADQSSPCSPPREAALR